MDLKEVAVCSRTIAMKTNKRFRSIYNFNLDIQVTLTCDKKWRC
mgnify:CR=1 FL=1